MPSTSSSTNLPLLAFLPEFICLEEKGQQEGLVGPETSLAHTSCSVTGDRNSSLTETLPLGEGAPATGGPRMEGKIKCSNDVVRLN